MVYFVEGGSLVKIGFTLNLERRLMAMQANCPHQLKCTALMEGDVKAEKALHRKFKADRVHGEWFRKSKPIKELMSQHKIDPTSVWEKAKFKPIKLDLTPQQIKARSERARKLVSEGKIGGPRPGSGRPRKKPLGVPTK